MKHRILSLLLLSALGSPGEAGTFIFAESEQNPDLVVHPNGFRSSNPVDVGVCISSLSPLRSSMEIPVRNVVARFNQFVPVLGNVQFSSSDEVAGTQIDFESVALHEVGHCLGLGHSNAASESGLSGVALDSTKALPGSDGAFDIDDGSDSVIGTADDRRGDDINLFWFFTATNNPFFINVPIVDETTFSVDERDLPSGDNFAATAGRQVAAALGLPETEAVMHQGSFFGEIQRALSADDVATLRFAQTGTDRRDDGGSDDDYLVELRYEGVRNPADSRCDITLAFDNSQTGFAVCQVFASLLSSDRAELAGANAFFNSDFNWFFSDTRIPEPGADSIAVGRGAAVTTLVDGESSLLANDGHPQGFSLRASTDVFGSIETFGGPNHGSVQIQADGSFVYTHDGSNTTSDSFVYRVCTQRNEDACAHGSVRVMVSQGPPEAFADSYQVAEAQILDGGVDGPTLLDNDTDPDPGDMLNVSLQPLVGPTHGSLTLAANGTFRYEHDGSETTSDSFVYEVSDSAGLTDSALVEIDIQPVNDAPSAFSDTLDVVEAGEVDRTTTNSASLLDNDTDAEGDRLVLSQQPFQAPVFGTIELETDGGFVYRHDGSESTADTLIYEVCDDGTPNACSLGVVLISIDPVNDAPLAMPDAAQLNEGGTVEFDLRVNDSDPESDELLVSTTPVRQPVNGALILDAGGVARYTHDGSETTADSFRYQLCDDGLPRRCSEAEVSLSILPINDPPVLSGEIIDVDEGGTATSLRGGAASLLANDTDPENGQLAVVGLVQEPSFGSAELQPDGRFSYVHNGTEEPADSFIYEACDDGIEPACSSALVTVAIAAVNDAPAGATNFLEVGRGGIVEMTVGGAASLLDNDSDAEGQSLRVELAPALLPAAGDLELFADGSFRYEHDAGPAETDLFRYTVCDASDACTETDVVISIGLPPTALCTATGVRRLVANRGAEIDAGAGLMGNLFAIEGLPASLEFHELNAAITGAAQTGEVQAAPYPLLIRAFSEDGTSEASAALQIDPDADAIFNASFDRSCLGVTDR